MSRLQFDCFVDALPPDPIRIPVPPDLNQILGQSVPEELREFWEKYELGGFGDSALNFFDPRRVAKDVARLSGRANAIPFARTAFGDVFSVDSNTVFLTSVEYRRTVEISPSLDIFGFGTFKSKRQTDDLLMRPYKDEAERKLGKLDPGECYGYRLALAAGGKEDIDNLEIKRFEAYLAVLADLTT